jgi:hypothetical protein
MGKLHLQTNTVENGRKDGGSVMERNEVYRMIDGERAYQQAQGWPNEHKPTKWLDIIEYYSQKAWSNTHTEPLMDNLRKIAAVAVAALEQYGCPPREGYEQPALPDLNWEAAPNWATHHVYNCMGSGLWISGEATVDETWSSGWSRVSEPWNVDYSGYRLPIRIDWRTTLQTRPVTSDREVEP